MHRAPVPFSLEPRRLPPLLPQFITVRQVAALTGRSPQAIRSLIAAGILESTGTVWRLIPTASVEKLLNRPVTPEEFLKADRTLDGGRQRLRAYNKSRKTAETHRRGMN